MNKLSFIGVGGAGGNFISFLNEKEPVWKTEVTKNDKIQPEIIKATTVCLISGLGGNSSANNMLKILEKLRDAGKTVWVIAITPFEFEGKEREEASKREVEELKGADKLFVYSNQNLLDDKEVVSQELTTSEMFQRANEAIYKAILNVRL